MSSSAYLASLSDVPFLWLVDFTVPDPLYITPVLASLSIFTATQAVLTLAQRAQQRARAEQAAQTPQTTTTATTAATDADDPTTARGFLGLSLATWFQGFTLLMCPYLALQPAVSSHVLM